MNAPHMTPSNSSYRHNFQYNQSYRNIKIHIANQQYQPKLKQSSIVLFCLANLFMPHPYYLSFTTSLCQCNSPPYISINTNGLYLPQMDYFCQLRNLRKPYQKEKKYYNKANLVVSTNSSQVAFRRNAQQEWPKPNYMRGYVN